MGQIGCRWEDAAEQAMERAGFDVIERAGVADYQGWGVLMGRNGMEYAILGWSYGSCSGCDSYEGLSESDLAAEFDDLVLRHLTNKEACIKFNDCKGW